MKKALFYLIGLSLTLSLCGCIFLSYLRFSYLIVPFKQVAAYEMKLKVSQQSGYFKFQPGTYDNAQMGIIYLINADGLRGITTKSDLKDAYSVIAFGESSTMGIEVEDDQTWPEQLSRRLVQKGLNSRVLNAGVGGINSLQMLNFYQTELSELKPKVVIYYAGRNDHGLGSGLTRFPGAAAWPQGFWHWFKQYFVFTKAQISFYQYKLFGAQYLDFFSNVNPWLVKYKANLSKLIEQTKYDKTCFVIAQQMMPFEKKTIAYLKDQKYDQARASISLQDASWPELFRQVALFEAQAELAAKYRVPVVELLSAPNFLSEGLFVDTVHLTAKGNEFIASHLAQELPDLCASSH